MVTILLADVLTDGGTDASHEFYDVGLSTIGGTYGANEDFGAALKQDDGASVAVAIADGIGSQPHGRALSRLACLASISSFAQGATLSQAFGAAASEVRSFIRDARSPKSGTTLLLAKAKRDKLRLRWEGDGSCLVVGHDGCREVTHAHRSLKSKRITRYLGADITTRPECVEVSLKPGDTVVLMTDGVSDQLDHKTIEEAVRLKGTAGERARRLVQQARTTGRDDATAVVLTMR